jgi:CRP-like cAMP-binding protein
MVSFAQKLAEAGIFTQEEIEQVVQLTAIGKYPKGHYLVQPEEPCRHIYFLESSYCRMMYLKDGKEVTEIIYAPGDFITILEDHLQQSPGKRGLEIVADSVVRSFPLDLYDEMSRQNNNLLLFSRKVLYQYTLHFHTRLENLLFMNAHDRYKALLEEKPEWFKEINLGVLASYMGMTQETLSRVRTAFDTDQKKETSTHK